MIIYGIINKINHKMYLGLSVKNDITSSQSRPYKHLHGIGDSYSKLVFAAVQKYGIENFLVIIIHQEDCTREKLNELEIYYIKHFKTRAHNGYNLTDGGDGFNGVFTEAHKSNLSKALKIALNTPEIRKKRSIFAKVHQNKPEVRAKNSRRMKELRNTPEDRKRNSSAQLIAWNRPETKKKHKDTWDNRSEEEKDATEKKRAKTWENKSAEEKSKQADTGIYTNHIRWHFNRGILNLDCKFCIEQIMGEHS
jgi:group I intron endonuclease